jgi:LacI family transcriptional regulator
MSAAHRRAARCLRRIAGAARCLRRIAGRHDVSSEAWGRQGASILLRNSPDVQAIFCGSDQITRGVSDTLRMLGRNVPDDIALIGFDNWEPMACGADPPLTSIDMCLEDVGRVAAEHLLSAINGEPTHGTHTVPCRLVARGSTGSP